jgi:DNA invertase Pin-like site-specific DNA recombinase
MLTGTVKRFLGYRRVSTGEQGTAGTSLDGQKEELTQLAVRLGAPVVLDFVEVESGAAEKEERRVEVARLLDAVRPGDVVAVAKFDRFTRDLEFAIRKVREILNKGARFISIAEGEFDRSAEGELKLSIWASIAQMERARIRDRTHGQKVRLRAQGKFLEGLPPFGYMKAKGRDSSDKPRRLVVDPENAKIVVEMFERCVRGESIQQIVRYLRAHYTQLRFTNTWVSRALHNRVYTGQLSTTPVRPRGAPHYFQAQAQWIDAHEPIVAMELFLRAQAALASRRAGGDRPSRGSGTEYFLMRGLATCGLCGSLVRGVPVHETCSTKHLGYYVCRHRTHPPEGKPRCAKAPYVQQKIADSEIERATLARLIELRDILAAAPEPTPEAPDFESKRASIAARRKRLVQAVAAGKLGLDDIDAPIAELDAELAAVEVAAAEHAARVTTDTVEARRAALGFVDVVSKAWKGLIAEERRSVIAVLAERIVMTADREVHVTWRDASGLTASVASVRPELVARLVDTTHAAPLANDEADVGNAPRTRSRAAKRTRVVVRPAA